MKAPIPGKRPRFRETGYHLPGARGRFSGTDFVWLGRLTTYYASTRYKSCLTVSDIENVGVLFMHFNLRRSGAP